MMCILKVGQSMGPNPVTGKGIQFEPAVNCIGKERQAQTHLAQLGGEGNFPPVVARKPSSPDRSSPWQTASISAYAETFLLSRLLRARAPFIAPAACCS